MPPRKDRIVGEMRALRAEIDRRGRRPAASPGGRALDRSGRGAFAGVPTSTLIRMLRDHQRAIYGTDDRRDVFQIRTVDIRALADSVAALVEASNLRKTADGRYRLKTTTYQEDYELCDGEPFASQPLGCFCSGFLVAPDVVATAGHCVRSSIGARRTRFVFGFHMLDHARGRTTFRKRDVYSGLALLAREEDEAGADWALVQLDRPVVGRRPLRVRSAGKIADGRPLFVIGHPNGLPAKFADGARVRGNRRRAFFVANLDTYGGNSGSPVFDGRSTVVEGILASGEDDFVRHGDCFVSLVCPDTECRGEAVTRATLWADRIPSDT
jgi:V8-like Glu-specific endopeptidase